MRRLVWLTSVRSAIVLAGGPAPEARRGRIARAALLDHDIGLFVAPPGSGKTVVVAHLVARRGGSTLILVHRTQLLHQWITQLSIFLDLQTTKIGQIGAESTSPTEARMSP